jgi:hypothetical protein
LRGRGYLFISPLMEEGEGKEEDSEDYVFSNKRKEVNRNH